MPEDEIGHRHIAVHFAMKIQAQGIGQLPVPEPVMRGHLVGHQIDAKILDLNAFEGDVVETVAISRERPLAAGLRQRLHVGRIRGQAEQAVRQLHVHHRVLGAGVHDGGHGMAVHRDGKGDEIVLHRDRHHRDGVRRPIDDAAVAMIGGKSGQAAGAEIHVEIGIDKKIGGQQAVIGQRGSQLGLGATPSSTPLCSRAPTISLRTVVLVSETFPARSMSRCPR